MEDKKSSRNVIHLNSKFGENNNINHNSSDTNKAPRVISIASGKGGVGKTNIVANLAFSLCELGKKVLVFDADLGLGNLDILLGLTPKYNLSHFITGEKELEDIIISGPGNMKIIPAASGIKELADLSKEQKIPVFNAFDELINKYDIFLIDTAAGISKNVLHFNALAQEVMIIVSPEPTSITDAYALIKVLSYHYSTKQFNLIVNMAQSEQEAMEVYDQLTLVTNQFLDVSICYTGYVSYDEKITKGVRRQKIINEIYPEASSSKCFKLLAKTINNTKEVKRNPESSNFMWRNLINYYE